MQARHRLGHELALLLGAVLQVLETLLHLANAELARAAGVASRTLVDFERDAKQRYSRTLRDIVAALEKNGIELIEGNGRGPGVRFKEPV